jgi:predicted metalloprotease with PDZ domain
MPAEEMDIAADSELALAMPQDFAEGYIRLMHEAEALFGAHHFRSYHFLVALSDHFAAMQLEHHESTDDHFSERALIDLESNRDDVPPTLAHELAHSWNGKYRRPIGLATTDYQQPMKTELVWVYEGLTTYLGDILTARSGFWTSEEFREIFASTFAQVDHTAGRAWRPLVDAAISAPFQREAGPEWDSWPSPGPEWGSLRRLDYYDEGELLWLEVDTTIRRQTSDRRSLDDFCHAFFGPPGGLPIVKPYPFNDLVAALNEVAPYDWRSFFQKRVYEIAPHPPLGGIEQGGWKLIYNAEPNDWMQSQERLSHAVNLLYSVGMIVQEKESEKEATIVDVVPGMAAAEAGIAPGMKLVAVNGQPWSPEVLLDALKHPGSPPRLELLVENAGFLRTYNLRYGGGPARVTRIWNAIFLAPTCWGKSFGPVRCRRPLPIESF